MSQASPSSLLEQISERIRHDGPLTFAEYMRMALYEPGYGYYVTGSAKMGWSGDYFTSTDVSELFAHCLGRQLYAFWEKLRRPTFFRVLEQGAGRGDLATGVRAWASQQGEDFAEALDYRTADIAAGQDSLHPHLQDGPGWHVMLSNELLDAFPVHVVEKRGTELYEVFVDLQGHTLHEVLDQPSSQQVANYLEQARIPWSTFPDGWRAEINLDALDWLERSVALLAPHAFLLAIDYGEKARILYTRERRKGTLLCYRHHQTNERPLLWPGEQDITAHVNFSSLIDQGHHLGMRLHKYTTQREWLNEWGLAAELEERRQRDFALAEVDRASNAGQVALLGWYNLRQRAAILTDPNGMGNFKVMVLRR
jgi:SAM-dependent MidA family methyltransferase